jgi:subtilisin family serine protease
MGAPAPAGAVPFDPLPSKPPTKTPPSTGRLVVELGARADLGRARNIGDWGARGSFVADTLRANAEQSHRGVLDAVGRTPGAKARPFWIRNSVIVEGATPELREQLSRLPGVQSVREEHSFEIEEPINPKQAILAAAGSPEWGVAKVGADQAWDRGVLGGGIVVGSIDSGVDYLHPAITQQYRGNLGNGTFDHNYNWLDASHTCPSADPCDLDGHGTHTMGTIVGGDGPGPFSPDIGVAPAAKWMSAGCGPQFCTETQLLDAAQFILAPFGDASHPADPSKRPHVVSNSWGTEVGGDPFLTDLVTAWRSAGIVPVFSAGNEGSACGTLGSPGDYADAFTVGATDPNDVIASFSSRGPSTFDARPKPNVTAPGVDIVSSYPGGSYRAISGTSMAAPHVAGAVALALSSAPPLTVDQVTGAVAQTAVNRIDTTCGGDADGDPNNVYGDGRIDANAAVSAVDNGGTVTGQVTVSGSATPVGGARVTATGGGRQYGTVVAADGSYTLFLPAGTYSVTASAFGFNSVTQNVTITVNQTVTANIAMPAAPSFTVSGRVARAENNVPLVGVRVDVLGVPRSAVTDSLGRYSVSLPAGTYQLRVTRGGCAAPQTSTVVVTNAAKTVNFNLVAKTDAFGHGCQASTFEWENAAHQTGLTGDDEYGRLFLPFSFPYYGANYRSVYVTTNGLLSFIDPGFATPGNNPIPDGFEPHAAIYPLWQNLAVEGDASITWDREGIGSTERMIISYNRMRVRGSSGTVTFQVRLWATGSIDMTYQDTTAVERGINATIGIESPNSQDALQFGFSESVVPSNTTWRYREVTSGTVQGTVVDFNDGQPVAGATVTAQPGGRSAITDTTGRYELRLIPGSYTLGATARNYQSGSVSASVSIGGTTTASTVRLRTGIATVSPTSLSVTHAAGQTSNRTVTLTNTGSAPLTWTADDRTAPRVLPPGSPAPLRRIINDPAGDAINAPIDVVSIDAGSTPDTFSASVNLSASTPIDQALGVVMLDTDRNPATGVPATMVAGQPGQDVGVEYIVNLLNLHDPENPHVEIIRPETNEVVGTAPGSIQGQSLVFHVPLSLLGPGEDGEIDVAGWVGFFGGVTDWAPDAGHGTAEVRADAPWITESPASGTLAPGASVNVQVAVGSPTLTAGTYTADLRFLTNAARVERRLVPVTLQVT